MIYMGHVWAFEFDWVMTHSSGAIFTQKHLICLHTLCVIVCVDVDRVVLVSDHIGSRSTISNFPLLFLQLKQKLLVFLNNRLRFPVVVWPLNFTYFFNEKHKYNTFVEKTAWFQQLLWRFSSCYTVLQSPSPQQMEFVQLLRKCSCSNFHSLEHFKEFISVMTQQWLTFNLSSHWLCLSKLNGFNLKKKLHILAFFQQMAFAELSCISSTFARFYLIRVPYLDHDNFVNFICWCRLRNVVER